MDSEAVDYKAAFASSIADSLVVIPSTISGAADRFRTFGDDAKNIVQHVQIFVKCYIG